MKKKIRSNAGITLVALVVTIIVLLILAGVTINTLVGDNGIIARAKESAKATKDAAAGEYSTIEELEAQISQVSSEYDKVNKPSLKTGMTPIYFEENSTTKMYDAKTTTVGDSKWYDYDAKHWANAQTKDGSMWVWVPRFAYKVNSATKTFDVVFLIGKTDYYYESEGKIKKAVRATTDYTPDTSNEYTVHPAFTNESSIGFANGGWDSELTGIWVAKFEAGFATSNGNSTPNIKSTVKYTQGSVWAAYAESKVTEQTSKNDKGEDVTTTGKFDGSIKARNWLDGEYGNTETKISYPSFQGTSYSMNYVNHKEAFALCSVLNEDNNVYGLSGDTDSHLMKNSEWGAAAYLGKSKYGLNEDDIYINNVNMNSGTASGTVADDTKDGNGKYVNPYLGVYAITGVESSRDASDGSVLISSIDQVNDADKRKSANIKVWNEVGGGKSSTTGNVYGIFDMSGGEWERTADYITNKTTSNHTSYGNSYNAYTSATKNKKAFVTDEKGNLLNASSKYATMYAYSPDEKAGTYSGDDYTAASILNYNYAKGLQSATNGSKVNRVIYGSAIFETSTEGNGNSSWYNDCSYFPSLTYPFFIRGGSWVSGDGAGLFSFYRGNGGAYCSYGFRAVLV